MIANLVDTDGDGIADNEQVVKALAYEGSMGAGMICGSTYEQERQEEKFDNVMDYVFSCQAYNGDDFNEWGKTTLFEEAIHMFHQNGFSFSVAYNFWI